MGEAEAAITEIDQDYEPWYASPWNIFSPMAFPARLKVFFSVCKRQSVPVSFSSVFGRLTMRSKMRKQMAAAGVDVESVEHTKVGKNK